MPYIHAIDTSLLWAVTQASDVLAHGLTEPGGLTMTGEDKTFISDASEVSFLGALPVTEFPALPPEGWLEAGDIYNDGGVIVMVRQSHNRTIYPPAETPALFVVYQPDAASVLEWVVGEDVAIGTLRTYGGVTYRCLVGHVTQSDWSPDRATNLWAVYTPPTQANEWVPGVHYDIGDVVTYNGLEYECRQPHDSQVGWEPPNLLALWLPL